MSALTQIADILYPQLEERMPGVIPVGIDQDPHIRLARDVVKRTKAKYGFFPPAGFYQKYTPALNGSLRCQRACPKAFWSCRKMQEGLAGK